MAAVGFDLGSLNSYVCIAKQGGIETADNEYSDRCNPVIVSFDEQDRYIGHVAKQKQATNARNTVYGVTRLIGKSINDKFLAEEKKMYPYAFANGEEGRPQIEVDYLGEKQMFYPEQITAMYLSKLKQVAESKLNAPVVDVVINIPVSSTDSEKRAMLDAAQICGLNCVRLLTDTTAAGIAFGIYNRELPEADKESMNVVIVDMGHCNLQVSVIAFNKGKMKVLTTKSDRNVGGRAFTFVIFHHMVKAIREKYKLDVMSSPKAQVRLFEECEKLKKLMSANSTDIPMNIECFMNDVDVSTSMKRAEFEKLAIGELTRVEELFKSLLSELDEAIVAKIDRIEIVGASTRLPAVKRIISKFFNKEPRTSLNADEAIAKGCALQCAALSPAFRVKEFVVQDACQYAISVAFDEVDAASGTVKQEILDVFPKGHTLPFSRQITFMRSEPFVLSAFYANESQLPNDNKVIGNFKITQVVPDKDGNASKVKVKLRLNSHGIFTCSQAQLIEKVEKEVEEEFEVPDETVNGDIKEKETPMDTSPPSAEPTTANEATQNAADKKPSTTSNDSFAGATSASPGQNVKANGEAAAKSSKVEAPKMRKEKRMIKKTVTNSTDLPVQAIILQWLPAKINEFVEKEGQMALHTKVQQERMNAKNMVEEYVYDMRDIICGELEPFVAPEEKEPFQALLTETEDWLYGDGESLQKRAYVDKLEELKKFGNKFYLRSSEAALRTGAIESFSKSAFLLQQVLNSYAEKKAGEPYSHLTEEEVLSLSRILQEKQHWFTTQIAKQSALKLYQDPICLASQIDARRKEMEKAANPIVTKPKPNVEPPKVSESKASAEEMDATTRKNEKNNQRREASNDEEEMDVQ